MNTYDVWFPDEGEDQDDARPVKATDPATAAEESVESRIHRSAEYGCVDGDPVRVCLLDPDGAEFEFLVSVWSSINYSARPVEP